MGFARGDADGGRRGRSKPSAPTTAEPGAKSTTEEKSKSSTPEFVAIKTKADRLFCWSYGRF